MNVVFARRAQQDIADIYTTIAADNPVAAQRVEDAIRLTCDTIGLFPFASAPTDEPSVRRAPLVRYPYTIL